MATITKRDLVVMLSNKTGLPQQEVMAMVESTIGAIADSLGDGHDVVIRSLGSFRLRLTKPKVGRNPKNPTASVPIPARMTVKFKAGQELKHRLERLPTPKRRGRA